MRVMARYLQTPRLILRQFTAADVDALVELDSDPAVMRYVTGGRGTPRAEIRDEVLPFWMAYDQRGEGYGFWAAIDRATATFSAGSICARARAATIPAAPSWVTGCGVRRGAGVTPPKARGP